MMTQNTKDKVPEIIIYARKKNVMLREKALLAYDTNEKKITAIGNEADSPFPIQVDVKCPFQNGRITEFLTAVQIFTFLLKKATNKNHFFIKPKVALCVPESITGVERKVYEDVAYMMGAKKVFLTVESIEVANESVEPEYDIVMGLVKNWEEEQIVEEKPSMIRIYSRQGELLVEDSLLLALEQESGRITAIGREAETIDSTSILFKNAFCNRRVAEFEEAEKLFQYYMKVALKQANIKFKKPDVLICNLPHDLTEIDKKAYEDLAFVAGAKSVCMAEYSYSELSTSIPKNVNLVLEIAD